MGGPFLREESQDDGNWSHRAPCCTHLVDFCQSCLDPFYFKVNSKLDHGQHCFHPQGMEHPSLCPALHPVSAQPCSGALSPRLAGGDLSSLESWELWGHRGTFAKDTFLLTSNREVLVPTLFLCDLCIPRLFLFGLHFPTGFRGHEFLEIFAIYHVSTRTLTLVYSSLLLPHCGNLLASKPRASA